MTAPTFSTLATICAKDYGAMMQLQCIETLPPSEIDRDIHKIAQEYTKEVRERRRADAFNVYKK
jgi:hypothetical protein